MNTQTDVSTSIELRAAQVADAPAIHALIVENLEVGHLLPRSLEDLEEHAARFVVAACEGTVVGCAELAPLSAAVAEVRSLVVDQPFRGRHIGGSIIAHLSATAIANGFVTLCAFTHDPSHFVRLGFTIVPHVWVPEKIAHDCTGCALFRRCGQYAVMLTLRQGATIGPERPAALVRGRGVAARRFNIERLQLRPVAADGDPVDTQPVEPVSA